MKIIKLFTVMIALAFFLNACAKTEAPGENSANANTESANSDNTAPAPTAVDEVAEGGKLYVENCAKCHKESGKGGPMEIEGVKIKPDDLTGAKLAAEPDSEYIEYITNGIKDEGMPAFKDVLTEAQINQVIKYVRKEIQKQ